MLDTRAGASDKTDDPAVVAEAAFKGLTADKDKVVPTLKNKVMASMSDITPDMLAAAQHRLLSEPGSADN